MANNVTEGKNMYYTIDLKWECKGVGEGIYHHDIEGDEFVYGSNMEGHLWMFTEGHSCDHYKRHWMTAEQDEKYCELYGDPDGDPDVSRDVCQKEIKVIQ